MCVAMNSKAVLNSKKFVIILFYCMSIFQMCCSLEAGFIDLPVCVTYVCMATGFLEAAFVPRHCVILWRYPSSVTSLEGLISMPHIRKKLVSLMVVIIKGITP